MVNDEFKHRIENVLGREGLAKLLCDLKPLILQGEGDKEYSARALFLARVEKASEITQKVYNRLPFQSRVMVFNPEEKDVECYLELDRGEGYSYEEAFENLVEKLEGDKLK